MLLDHAAWWLAASPAPDDFDVLGAEARFLVRELSDELVSTREQHEATLAVLRAALAKLHELNRTVDRLRVRQGSRQAHEAAA